MKFVQTLFVLLSIVFSVHSCGNAIWFADTKQKQEKNNFLALLGMNAKDTTRPKVVSVKPENSSINVPIDPQIEIEFDKDMDPNTITSTNLFLVGVNSMVQYSGKVARITPSPLAPNKEYIVKVSQNVKDLSGNMLLEEYTSTFTTGTSISNTSNALSVASIFPADGATNVSLTTSIAVSFTKEINPGTLSNSSFQLYQGTSLISSNTSPVGKIGGVLYPLSTLSPNTTYTIKISTAVTDNSSPPVALPSEFTSTFTTGSSTSSNLLVTGTSPTSGATQVSTNAKMIVVLDRALDSSTVNTTNVLLQNTSSVPGTVNLLGSNAIVFSPTNPLPANTAHTLTVTTGVLDTGVPPNSLSANYNISFTTGNSILNPNPPTVVSTVPTNGATGVSITPSIVIQFSEPMNSVTINTTNISLKQGMVTIPSTVQLVGDSTAVLVPNSSLNYNTVYTIEVGTGVQDISIPPDNMTATYTSAFTTQNYPALSVTGIYPTNGGTNIPLNTPISVTFSNPMNVSTITTANVTLTLLPSTPVSGTITLVGNQSFQFLPSNMLSPSSTYSFTISSAVQDTYGNFITGGYTIIFSTADSEPDSGSVTTLAGPTTATSGYVNATGNAARFNFPRYLSMNLAENAVFVTDTNNHAVRMISYPSAVVSTFAGATTPISGFLAGTGTAARFNSPRGIYRWYSDGFSVTDTGNHAIRGISAGAVVTNSTPTTVNTAGFVVNTGAATARFNAPEGVHVFYDVTVGHFVLIVPDKLNHTIRKIRSDYWSYNNFVGSIAPTPTPGFVDGLGTAARFNTPAGVTVDSNNNIYITDSGNHVIRKITIMGQVTTIAGNPGVSGYQNGIGSSALFNNPTGIAVGPGNVLYVTDTGNCAIRKIVMNDLGTYGVVTTFAGALPPTPNCGYVNSTRLNSRFNQPVGLYVMGNGRILVTDTNNHAIRMIIP